MRRYLVVSITLAIASVGVFGWLRDTTPAASDSVAQSAAQDMATEGPQKTVRASSLPTALPQAPALDAQHYAVEFHNEFLPADGDSNGLLLGFSAELTISQVAEDGELRWSQFALSELVPLVDSDGRNFLEGPEKEHLVTGLTQAFYLGSDASGRAEKLRLTRPSDALIENILRLVAEATQFVAQGDGQTSYRSEELDTVGLAQVAYRLLEKRTYEKRKLGYLKLLSEEGLLTPEQAGIEVFVEGATRVVRSADNRYPLALHIEEDTRTKLADATLSNHTELSLRWIEARSSEPARNAFAKHRHLPEIDLRRAPVVRPIDPEKQLRELVGGKSTQDLIAEARRLSPEDEAARRDVLAQLEASLKLEPQGASDVLDAFRKADDAEASLLLSALGNAGTKEAQAALGSIAADPNLDGGKRESAFALLGITDNPSEESVEVVREATRDKSHPHRQTALLALGNLKQRLGDGDTSDDIYEELLRNLRQAQNDEDRVLHLVALGNTGDRRLPEALRPFLQQGSPSVRAETAWALRLVGTQESFALLETSLAADADPQVRQRAIDALRYRQHEGTPKVLAAAAMTDPDDDVRLNALNVLAFVRAPSVRELAQVLAKRDPSAAVREEAERILRASST